MHRVRADRRVGGRGRRRPRFWIARTSRSATARTWCSWARASRAGTGHAVVVATAMNTEIGRIAGLIAGAASEETTPLQKKLESFGRDARLGGARDRRAALRAGAAARDARFELFMTSVSLAVAAVPEGLPAVVTVALALGVHAHGPPPRAGAQTARGRDARLDQRHLHGQDRHADRRRNDRARAVRRGHELRGHRRRLRAGRRDPLRGQASGRAERRSRLLELATVLLGCNNAHLVREDGTWKAVGDPTEGALLAAGTKAGGDRAADIEREVAEASRDPVRLRPQTQHGHPQDARTGSSARSSTARPTCCSDCCTRLYTRRASAR